jgi:diaminohydroxyphosphoribosylaminopyrimidine deaminase/5-amino-6-(5-phosphoribosylamino)uracil reductase
MAEALDLARRPLFTSPNPRVGAVVVRSGEVISRGAHEGAGTPHAEAVALAGTDARGATLYVNLEPCAHEGRTPPCAQAIVDAGVARAVVAIEDPDERVSGRGLSILSSAGISLTLGTLAAEAARLNAPFLHHRKTGKPFVTLKLALSLDGRMGAADRSSRWITGEDARRRVHRRRVEADAVLVGSGTVLTDDPSLLATTVDAPRQPLRVVVDSRGRLDPSAQVFDGRSPSVIATTDASSHEVQTAWKERGAEVIVLGSRGGGVDLTELLTVLGARDVVEVLCEGGAELASSMLRRDLVDRLEVWHAPILLGEGGPALGDLGVDGMAAALRWRVLSTETWGEDSLTVLERGAA